MPRRPPRKWFYRVVAKIRKYRPQIKSPEAVAGWLWYHGMKAATKAQILKAEELKDPFPLLPIPLDPKTKKMLEGYRLLRESEKHPKVKYPGVETGARELHDPIKQRKRLIARPAVVSYADFEGRDSMIRVLLRTDETAFPELALYPSYGYTPPYDPKRMAEIFKEAGFTDEGRGKWVFRSNKFSVFVYL
jgi:hypothetical protein